METVEVIKPQSVRECFVALGAGKVAAVAGSQRSDAERVGKFMTNWPILGGIMQNLCLRKYRRDTGNSLDAAMDWQKFMDWLVTNLPVILQMIMTIITLFGG